MGSGGWAATWQPAFWQSTVVTSGRRQTSWRTLPGRETAFRPTNAPRRGCLQAWFGAIVPDGADADPDRDLTSKEWPLLPPSWHRPATNSALLQRALALVHPSMSAGTIRELCLATLA